jgi:hypothetical protein
MMRKTVFALTAVALMSLAGSPGALAHGGGGGGGGHGGGGGGGGHFGGGGGGHFGGGGFHGGGGGGFRGGGFHDGFHRHGFIGIGVGPFPYDSYYYDNDEEGGCYLVRRRVHTHHGWRIRRFEVCD